MRRARYRAERLTDKRYRWDLLWACGMAKFVINTLYDYCNDDHIDTALREIVPPL